MEAKQKFKYFVLGMVAMTVFSLVVGPSMAIMVQKQIKVSTGVNVYVDDVKLKPVDANGNPIETFIYNGTTYLPVRAVADAVGKPVFWDGKTSSVYLGKHDMEEPIVMLHELDYFATGGNTRFKTYTDVKDNLGNSYNFAIAAHDISYSDGWQTYYLNGIYSKMKGRYILNYEHRGTDSENRFKVYGDSKLIYSSPVMTGGVHPVDFEIDLTGVLELKIEYHDHYGWEGSKTFLVDTGLYQ